MKSRKQLVFYGNWFRDFYQKLDRNTKEKIDWTLLLICETARVPKQYFKRLNGTNGLYEIRVQYRSEHYRLFCFFEREGRIVVLNAFQKKSMAIPLKEIRNAERLKKEYEKENG